jgi:DNA-directed RNA polymerase subunit beta'
MVLAKLPRGAIKTKDITGGLPRVAELFEARRPKDAAEIAKIDGVVDFRGVQKNKRIVVVRDEATGMEEEHLIPLSKHLIVQKGDLVIKGQQLTEGLVVSQEILEICGVRELQKYLVNQVQEVYRLQGVDINRKAIEEGGKSAQAAPVLLGITRASLGTESFLSAASFMETTRILTEASSESKTDFLLDTKANLIMGHMIPAGTGYEYHRKVNRFIEAQDIEQLDIDFVSQG